MNRAHLTYFEHEDILPLAVASGPETSTVELAPNITVELNEKDEVIGIEILNASKFLRDTLLDSIQARLLRLREFQPA